MLQKMTHLAFPAVALAPSSDSRELGGDGCGHDLSVTSKCAAPLSVRLVALPWARLACDGNKHDVFHAATGARILRGETKGRAPPVGRPGCGEPHRTCVGWHARPTGDSADDPTTVGKHIGCSGPAANRSRWERRHARVVGSRFGAYAGSHSARRPGSHYDPD